MRKGQVEGQIVVYVLAGVVVTLILLYGYKAVVDFSDKAGTVSYIAFRSQIDDTVQSVAGDIDSELEEEFNLPRSHDEVCFVDEDATSVGQITHLYKSSAPTPPLTRDIIADSYQPGAKTGDNVFLFNKGELADAPFHVDNIRIGVTGSDITTNTACFHADSGRIKLRLRGVGDGAVMVKPTGWTDIVN